MNILTNIIGGLFLFMAGGIVGMGAMAACSAAGRADGEMERMRLHVIEEQDRKGSEGERKAR